MTIDEAINAIKRQYPDISDTRITDYQFGFDRYEPSDIQNLIEHFFDNYEYQNPPKWAWFNKAAYKIGIQRKEKKLPSWWKCQDCGTEYSIQGRKCPKCRSPKAIGVKGESMPTDLIIVQEDCAYCTIFDESRKKENDKLYFGYGCNDYGVVQRGCTPRKCQCHECCRQMMLYNSDPRGTVEKYRTGELAQPWLYEVDPINETIRNMVNDIARRGI